MAAEYQLSLDLVTPEDADSRQRELLDTAKSRLGFVPNMYAAMANAPGILDTYLHGYELFRGESKFSPPEQEVVFLAISRENGCHYCMAAHSMLAEKQSDVPGPVLQAIREGSEIDDPKLAALARFTQRMVQTRGLPTRADVQAFTDAGYTERHILDIVLAQSVKTLSNYSNHLFHTEVDSMFADYRWSPSGQAA